MKKYIKPEIFSIKVETAHVISASDPNAHNEEGSGNQLTRKLWINDDNFMNSDNNWQDSEN